MLSVIFFNGVLETAVSVLQLKFFRRDKKGLLCEFYLFYVFTVVVFSSLNLRNHRVTLGIKTNKSCLVWWIDWSAKRMGKWPLCFRALPWLINDMDETVALLLVFSAYYNQMQVHLHKSHSCVTSQVLICMSCSNEIFMSHLVHSSE